MRKIIFTIIIITLINVSIFPKEISDLPENVHQDAIRVKGNWMYIKPNSRIAFLWDKNGNLIMKGRYSRYQASTRVGHWELWDSKGKKAMDEYFDEKGNFIKKINYFITDEVMQRPNTFPFKTYWRAKEKIWYHFNIKEKVLYTWFINGEKNTKTEFRSFQPLLYEGNFFRWYKNGSINVEGSYKNNQYHGKWILYNKQKSIKQIIYYIKDKIIWEINYEKKPPKKILLKHGNKIGWHVKFKGWVIQKQNIQYVYYDSGKLKRKTEMKGLDYHGKELGFYETGSRALVGQYKKSMKDGKWTVYRMDGNKMHDTWYKNGKEIDRN